MTTITPAPYESSTEIIQVERTKKVESSFKCIINLNSKIDTKNLVYVLVDKF